MIRVLTFPSLAYMEMRVILARFVWNFDLEFDDPAKSENWPDQKVFNLFSKPPLEVRLIPAKRIQGEVGNAW